MIALIHGLDEGVLRLPQSQLPARIKLVDTYLGGTQLGMRVIEMTPLQPMQPLVRELLFLSGSAFAVGREHCSVALPSSPTHGISC